MQFSRGPDLAYAPSTQGERPWELLGRGERAGEGAQCGEVGELLFVWSWRDVETLPVMGERETEGLTHKRKTFEVVEKYFQM